jgi:hypothetical protein
MSGAHDSKAQAGGESSPEYRNAVERLKSGEDLAWTASPRLAAEALNEALNAVRAERDSLRWLLRDAYSRVQGQYPGDATWVMWTLRTEEALRG